MANKRGKAKNKHAPSIPLKAQKIAKTPPNTDPSHMVTGTGYSANGTVAPQVADFTEQGSSYKAVIPDPLPDVSSPITALRTYLKMYRSDVSVRVSLRCGEGPILGGDYTVEPFDESEQSAAIAAFVDFNLFHAAQPWLTTLNQILKMFRDGFQVFEPVWELREWAPTIAIPGANRKVYTTLKKLAVRPTITFSDFEYDNNGELVALTQQAIGADFATREEKLDPTKLLVFTYDKDGGDIRGQAILRPVVSHWFYKSKLYAIDAIQKERHGIGIPEIVLQPGFKPSDKKAANEMGKNLRTNEWAYIVRTTMMDIKFAQLQGQPVDALASAIHHDNMIMKNILVQFLQIDHVSSGRNASATSMDMMMKSMRYIANYICDQINYYLIPAMVGYNFQTDQFPKLMVRNVGEVKDMQMWAAAMANLVTSGAIQVDDDTENFLRKVVDIPKRTSPRTNLDAPAKVTEIESTGGHLANGNGNGGGAGKGAVSNQIKTGNIGKSPSSGAV